MTLEEQLAFEKARADAAEADLERLHNADGMIGDGVGDLTAAEEVLAFFLIEKIGVPDDVPYSPNAACKIVSDRIDGLEATVVSLTEQLAIVTAERDSIADANHRQAHCIQLTAQALGPDYSATVDGLPKAAKHVAEQLAKAREETLKELRASISDWCYRQRSHPTPADIDLICKSVLTKLARDTLTPASSAMKVQENPNPKEHENGND